MRTIEKRSYRHRALLALLAVAICFPSACAGGTGKAQPADHIRPDARQAAAEMDRVYSLILEKFSDDAVFIAKMQAAHSAWRRFRDAHIESLYPAQDKALVYGSAYGQCRQAAIAELTRQRTEQLRQWLDGVEEGDVCAGSRPFH